MSDFSTQVTCLLFATASFFAAPSSTETHDPGTVTVHEWGTFTSIAGADGRAVEWLPQAGPTDLPCFVERNRFTIKGSLSGTVRMETPVLYFYTTQPATVDVNVRFRNGIITEWFPRAAVTSAGPAFPGSDSAIAWRQVKIEPRAVEAFPVEDGSSHYYAARRTGAAPLQVSSDREKFLFYRGVGRFALPIAATVDAAGRVAVRNSGREAVGDIIMFKNDRGRIAYDVLRDEVTTDAPVADQEPTFELETMLRANGLFAEEASAMIDTWRDWWFEEGTRLFYVVPRPAIDNILPLEITPRPTSVTRVFVGRMELVTPAAKKAIKDALLANDLSTLQRYGRFLDAIGRQIIAESAPGERALLERRLQRLYAAPVFLLAPASSC